MEKLKLCNTKLRDNLDIAEIIKIIKNTNVSLLENELDEKTTNMLFNHIKNIYKTMFMGHFKTSYTYGHQSNVHRIAVCDDKINITKLQTLVREHNRSGIDIVIGDRCVEIKISDNLYPTHLETFVVFDEKLSGKVFSGLDLLCYSYGINKQYHTRPIFAKSLFLMKAELNEMIDDFYTNIKLFIAATSKKVKAHDLVVLVDKFIPDLFALMAYTEVNAGVVKYEPKAVNQARMLELLDNLYNDFSVKETVHALDFVNGAIAVVANLIYQLITPKYEYLLKELHVCKS